MLRILIVFLSTAWLGFGAEVVKFKQRSLPDLIGALPDILVGQNKTNDQFGKGIWIVTDQDVMFPLAAAWFYADAANPYYHNREVLEAVMAAGDALIADADEHVMWEFRKKATRVTRCGCDTLSHARRLRPGLG